MAPACIAALFGLAAAVAAEASAQRAAQGSAQRPAIIDVHLHGYAAQEEIPAGSVNPVTRRPPVAATGTLHMRATLTEMRRHNVVRGYVSAGGGAAPEVVLPWHDADPERIVATFFMNGLSLPEPPALRELLRTGRFASLGEVGAQYAGLSLSDPRFEPYLAMAEELDLPVAVHTGISFPGISYEPCCRNFRTALGNPQTVEEVLNRHPRLRLSLMHAGWPYTQETIALMSVYPQLYADLAVIDWIIPRPEFHAHLERLMRAGLGERLMFGSDQMLWPEAIGMAIESIESAPFLSAPEKRRIFCENAARFLRLTGQANPCEVH